MGLITQVDKMEVQVPAESALKAVFIQPRPRPSDREDGFLHIYFQEVADVVEGSGELGASMAVHLRRWREDPGIPPSGHA